MIKKFSTVFTVLLLAASVAVAGAHKGPKAKAPLKHGAPDEVVQSTEGRILASPAAIGPGDSLGWASYAYGTNGAACHNIIVFDTPANGIAVARMGEDNGAGTVRGTYYTASTDYGATWSLLTIVESARSGWGNISPIVDAGNTEAITSHSDQLWNVDAAPLAGSWSETTSGGTTAIWPRLGIGSGFWFHRAGVVNPPPNGPTSVLYTRSPDAATTFDIEDMTIFTSGVGSADGYDLAAQGSNVAIAHFPQYDGSAGEGGADVKLATSSDNGSTWSTQIIHDVADAGELPEGQQEFQPDGSGAVIYDNAGNLHVVWSNFLAIGDATNTPGLFASVDAPMMHWSSATGVVTDVAFPDPDTTIVDPGGRGGNFATQPDIGVDANDNLYVIFSRFVNETDAKGNYYEHVFGTGSLDGGASWFEAVDLTPGTGFDAAFPSVADRVDMYVHFTYFSDDTAGNSTQGNHLANQTAVMYHRVPATDLTDVREIGGVLPSSFALKQNFPNPFNPATIIHYSVPTESFVTLKVYDVLGREVATLVNEEQAAGNYSFDFNASNLTSGTYFYKIQAGNFTDVRKMMLLK